MYDRYDRHDPAECSGELTDISKNGVFQCPDCGELINIDEKPSTGVASAASPVGTAQF